MVASLLLAWRTKHWPVNRWRRLALRRAIFGYHRHVPVRLSSTTAGASTSPARCAEVYIASGAGSAVAVGTVVEADSGIASRSTAKSLFIWIAPTREKTSPLLKVNSDFGIIAMIRRKGVIGADHDETHCGSAARRTELCHGRFNRSRRCQMP